MPAAEGVMPRHFGGCFVVVLLGRILCRLSHVASWWIWPRNIISFVGSLVLMFFSL